MLKTLPSYDNFIHELTPEDIPDDVLHHARRNFIDLVGVWAAGSRTKASRIACDHAARRHLALHDAVIMPFDGRKVSVPGAAFAGATTIDSVDAHDGHESCKGHAGAALLPTLIALVGDTPKCTLDEFLTTLIVGYEISIRCGLALHATVSDYHSSGSWNSIGCAAMGARVLGFDADQTRHALGIAEYYGPRAQMMRCIDHPTMVKDRSGWGAMVGANAIYLAEDGFTGAPALLCDSDETREYWHDLGENWLIRETNFKTYPVCRWAQPAIEASLNTLRQHDITWEQIETILVSTFHEATRLSATQVASCDEVQYNLPIPVAIAILKGTVEPQDLNENNLDDPNVLALAQRVQFAERDEYNAVFPEQRLADVTLTLKDGRVFISEPTVARGNYDAPLSDQEVMDKFASYCTDILPTHHIDMFMGLLSTTTESPGPDELLSCLSAKRY